MRDVLVARDGRNTTLFFTLSLRAGSLQISPPPPHVPTRADFPRNNLLLLLNVIR